MLFLLTVIDMCPVFWLFAVVELWKRIHQIIIYFWWVVIKKNVVGDGSSSTYLLSVSGF